ncbi:MAG: serine hydrolase [Bacteroidales bacterium]|nr:serine hydrolase [Bacteroidales bacterium]MDD2425133.1 serine hydrolase [Bacteroidales bacterium]MDD3989446.1 serine hydrolase [Bacteroidales bacterium]MDD4638917.1 serine hydrolase [Bacteroidales bacterium]
MKAGIFFRKFLPLVKLLFILLTGTSLFSTSLFSKDNRDNKAIAERIAEYAEKVRQEWKIPGMAISVVKDGELTLSRGFGVKELATVIYTGSGNKPFTENVEPLSEMAEKLRVAPENRVDPNTLFHVGSISKSFTALVMAQLVDQKLLKWEDSVSKILPDFQLYDKWVQENMMVKDIMTHSTGIKGQAGTYIPNLGYVREDIYKMLPLIKPAYSFRERYEYNNITFIIAAKIIEKLTGKSWEENVRERILIPLGMNSTILNGKELLSASNKAIPHEFNYSGAPVNKSSAQLQLKDTAQLQLRDSDQSQWKDSLTVTPLYGEDQALHWLTVIGPAGSVISSANDMAKYASFHLNRGRVNGKELLSRESFDFLHKGFTITSQDSARVTMYGHCWFIEQNSRYRVIFHTGTTWGFTALCAFVPEQNLAITILVNSDQPAVARYAIMRRLIDMYKGYPERDYSREYLEEYLKTSREKRIKSEKERLEAQETKGGNIRIPDFKLLTGNYDKGELFGKAIITLEDGKLYITVGPQGWKHRLNHSKGDTFRFSSDGHTFPLTFKFNKNRKRVTALEIDFGNEENFGEWRKLRCKKSQ